MSPLPDFLAERDEGKNSAVFNPSTPRSLQRERVGVEISCPQRFERIFYLFLGWGRGKINSGNFREDYISCKVFMCEFLFFIFDFILL